MRVEIMPAVINANFADEDSNVNAQTAKERLATEIKATMMAIDETQNGRVVLTIAFPAVRTLSRRKTPPRA